jgi:hypothetical protein
LFFKRNADREHEFRAIERRPAPPAAANQNERSWRRRVASWRGRVERVAMMVFG